jgi:hypothetical protein
MFVLVESNNSNQYLFNDNELQILDSISAVWLPNVKAIC